MSADQFLRRVPEHVRECLVDKQQVPVHVRCCYSLPCLLDDRGKQLEFVFHFLSAYRTTHNLAYNLKQRDGFIFPDVLSLTHSTCRNPANVPQHTNGTETNDRTSLSRKQSFSTEASGDSSLTSEMGTISSRLSFSSSQGNWSTGSLMLPEQHDKTSTGLVYSLWPCLAWARCRWVCPGETGRGKRRDRGACRQGDSSAEFGARYAINVLGLAGIVVRPAIHADKRSLYLEPEIIEDRRTRRARIHRIDEDPLAGAVCQPRQ